MTESPRDMTFAHSPGSGLPFMALVSGTTVAAFATTTGRDDWVAAQRRHGTVALTVSHVEPGAPREGGQS